MVEFAAPTFLAALVLAWLLTPPAGRLAWAVGLVAPVRADRLHREGRPYGGGVALALTLLLVGAAALFVRVVSIERDVLPDTGFWGTARMIVRCDAPMLPALAVGAVLFFILGLIDDRYALPVLPKLLLQFGAALVVVAAGISATVWLTVPHAGEVLSILWIVAVVNAYNMLDHADGVAAAVGAAALAALAVGQLMMGQALVAAVALAAAGALAGFLMHNFPPARLFMGDAGSALIGYLLAALTMDARYYFEGITPSRWVVLAPLAILAVPLFDMACVVAGRLVRGENPMRGDATSHLAHRMLARGVGPRTVVLFGAAMAALTGAASVMMYYVQAPMLLVPWGIVAAALGLMLVARRRPRVEAAR